MRRIMTFLTGIVVGGILVWFALHYHVIHAPNGLHLVPKASSTLAKSYVDIRGFTFADWNQHRDVAIAIMNAEKHELLQDAAGNALQNGLDRLLLPSEPQ